MIDYIIVGAGLAGIAFAETSLCNGKSVIVFDNNSQTSSTIAGGLYNPVILKRFSKLADAQMHLDAMNRFYRGVEAKLSAQLNYPMPVLRKFASVEEQNNWFSACDREGLSPFLSTKIHNKQYSGISSPFGYGEVLQTGYVDTADLLENYRTYLKNQKLLFEIGFDYHSLEITSKYVQYHNYKAQHIVFAEGFGIHSNPYFNYLPLDGTKGELFVIHALDLNLDVIVNTNLFILPLGNNQFKVGATYNWEDKSNDTTESGRAELIERIQEIILCDFEILHHYAGVRPTVKDRKPLIGTHPEHQRLHVLNGLGTRGVMLGPAMAETLYNHIENGNSISKEINITRFKLSDQGLSGN